MGDISNLMFKREHFPLGEYYPNVPVQLPPYHPSMANGFDPELVVSVLEQAVADTIKDLYEINNRHVDILKKMSDWEIIRKENYILVVSFPISSGQLVIENKRISPYGGDHNIFLGDTEHRRGIVICGDISEKLKREYELTDERKLPSGRKIIKSRYTWNYHNVCDTDKVLYKNLILEINNAVVRRKYSKH